MIVGQKNDKLRMVQPEALASISSVITSNYGKCKVVPQQDRRQKWKKNYMAVSMPCQYIHPKCVKNSKNDWGIVFSQSHTLSERKQNKYPRKLLKMLRKYAQSIEEISSRSYVDSMRSCSSSGSNDSILTNQPEDLIDLYCTTGSNSYSCDGPRIHRSSSKNLSEYVLPNGAKLGGRYPYHSEVDCKPVLTPKLRLVGSVCSSYVEDSYYTYSKTQSLNDLYTRSPINDKICNRADIEDYYEALANGKSTAFLSEEDQSFYYDDEFKTENLHNSDIEAALCNEYASFLEDANGKLIPTSSAHQYQSTISSDFDNIFPESISMRTISISHMTEENSDLEDSVPNYTNTHLAGHTDYQITFAHAGSEYSDTKSSCVIESDSDDSESEKRLHPKINHQRHGQTKSNQIPKPPRTPPSTFQTSTKKVSFSDELATLSQDCEKLDDVCSSVTWQKMKQNYTTWGQVKIVKEDHKKSQSTPDMRQVKKPTIARNSTDIEVEERKRYSLTLWEQYKRAHSLSLSASLSELTTPEAFTHHGVPTSKLSNSEDLRSINELLDDVLSGHKSHPASPPDSNKLKQLLKLPDVSYLRTKKSQLIDNIWWSEIFNQPSFCAGGSTIKTCSVCERKHSTDHQIIVFQGSEPAQHRICQISLLEQIFSPQGQCHCIREKLCDLSSGIATGSSGVTPREPNSWQHIADFLKKRQRVSGGNSRGSLNSILNDHQLLDVVACIEAADVLAKYCSQSDQDLTNDVMMKIWRLASALECILCLGLKSHKLVQVTMGKIRTRVSIWDVVDESAQSAGNFTDTFMQILSQVSRYQSDDISMRFCLFVVGLLNFQCLDFWLQTVLHNKNLMDKYYHEDSFMRSKVIADKKLQTEIIQSLQPLSLFNWDIDYGNMTTACDSSVGKESEEQFCTKSPQQFIVQNQVSKSPNGQTTHTSHLPRNVIQPAHV